MYEKRVHHTHANQVFQFLCSDVAVRPSASFQESHDLSASQLGPTRRLLFLLLSGTCAVSQAWGHCSLGIAHTSLATPHVTGVPTTKDSSDLCNEGAVSEPNRETRTHADTQRPPAVWSRTLVLLSSCTLHTVTRGLMKEEEEEKQEEQVQLIKKVAMT